MYEPKIPASMTDPDDIYFFKLNHYEKETRKLKRKYGKEPFNHALQLANNKYDETDCSCVKRPRVEQVYLLLEMLFGYEYFLTEYAVPQAFRQYGYNAREHRH